MQIHLDFSSLSFKIKSENNQQKIFDIIRKKWVIITPEEWVRQNILHYLIDIQNYPKGLIQVEKKISILDKFNRYDIVVFKSNQPWLVVECKATEVAISAKVIQQISAYNYILKAPYFLMTNGNDHYCFKIENGHFNILSALPEYDLVK